jgi:N-acetylmuramoyl-L-alanine amidase
MVVLHYTAMQSAEAALQRLCDPEIEVSAHYLIGETGQIWQMVDEEMRAWHAGAGQWGDVDDVNSRSIGIELANPATHPFPEPQMVALEWLLGDIIHRRAIRPERVIGHSDMAPGRKSDPGGRFDWHRLALQNLSVWPASETKPDQSGGFLSDAVAFGYALPQNVDDPGADLLNVFRLRFRPWALGPEDATDRQMIRDLATRFAVDRNAPNA